MSRRFQNIITGILCGLIGGFSSLQVSAAEPEQSSVDSIATLPRPVTSVYRYEVGRTVTHAQYLSPVAYSGTSMSFGGQWTKALPQQPERLVMDFNGGVDFQDQLNPAKTYRMYGLQGNFSWGLQRRWRLPGNWQVGVGGDAEVLGGVLYLAKNSNNPVQAIASLDLALTASASYRFSVGKIPILVSDRLRLPSLGVFFNQEYGETYYEIYLGNHSGLAHCGWWGNRFCIDNLISFQLDLGRTALELGYRYSLTTQWANSTSTRLSTNAFVIGVIPQGLGLKKPRKANFSIY